MAMLVRKKTYDRVRLMKRAAAARKKQRPRKVIAIYREILEHEPDDPEIHQKLAPLLARVNEAPEALASYQKAADALLKKGFEEQTIGLFRGAACSLPREVSVWRRLAELEAGRGRKADAVSALVEGRGNFRSRRLRPQAIQLLSVARKLDPSDFAVSFDLACLLAGSGSQPYALRLLEELAARSNSRDLRRVRARQLRISPGPGTAARFMKACLRRG